METNKTGVIGMGIAVALLTIGMIISIATVINTNHELNKYKEILDLSCRRAIDTSKCRAGIEMLEQMDINTIRKMAV